MTLQREVLFTVVPYPLKTEDVRPVLDIRILKHFIKKKELKIVFLTFASLIVNPDV